MLKHAKAPTPSPRTLDAHATTAERLAVELQRLADRLVPLNLTHPNMGKTPLSVPAGGLASDLRMLAAILRDLQVKAEQQMKGV